MIRIAIGNRGIREDRSWKTVLTSSALMLAGIIALLVGGVVLALMLGGEVSGSTGLFVGIAIIGAIIMAIEDRVKTATLFVCGISTRIKVLPEIDRVNYLPRVRKPVLMLNSRYDWNYPYDISQKPFYDLLGTPEEHKKLILYDESGHQVPWNAVIKETLNWYDQYLGKVQ